MTALRTTASIALLAALLCTSGCHGRTAPTAPLHHPWPTAFHDNQRTSRSDLPGPDKPKLLWRVQISPSGQRPRYGFEAAPIVASDGSAYLITDWSAFHRVDQSGRLRWSVPISRTDYAPLILQDGRVLVSGNLLQEVDAQGTPHRLAGMKFDLGTVVSAYSTIEHPLELEDRELLVQLWQTVGVDVGKHLSNGQHALVCRSSNGGTRWQYPLTGTGGSISALAADGQRIYVDDGFGVAGNLLVFDHAGKLLWKIPGVECPPWTPPVVGNGQVYVTSQKGSVLVAAKPNSTIAWSFSFGREACWSLALAADGILYAGTGPHRQKGQKGWLASTLWAIDPTGRVRWKHELGFVGVPKLSLDSAATVYAACQTGVTAYLPDGSVKWTFPLACREQAVIGPNKTLYVLDRQGGLNCIGEGP